MGVRGGLRRRRTPILNKGIFMQARFKPRGRRRLLKLALTIIIGLVLAYELVVPAIISFTLVHYRQPGCCVTPADRGMATYENVTITTADGMMLSGWYVPSHNRAAIIALHGSGGNRPAVLGHAALLARHGYGVLLLDVRGHGNSGGQFTLGWDANLDIDAAIAYLRARPEVDPDRIGALGLSMGGEVAMQAAAHTDKLKAVVSDGAGARSSWIVSAARSASVAVVKVGLAAPPAWWSLLPSKNRLGRW